jgi:hypothetical protein
MIMVPTIVSRLQLSWSGSGTVRPVPARHSGQLAAKWPLLLQSHSGGAPAAPQGAIDGTLKCELSGCYHGIHLRDSAIVGR